MNDYELINMENKEGLLQRIKQLESELSEELDKPVALIAYSANDEITKSENAGAVKSKR